ncbi:MAG TPA: DUF962 domain-containing protein [Candidatus Angelobacter sp.]|nr:DUF962 domain-containing protein [Candidatus Angelobacter sp.]
MKNRVRYYRTATFNANGFCGLPFLKRASRWRVEYNPCHEYECPASANSTVRFAWTGHFLIEGNKPATFGHPFWSFICDFRMLALMATGTLEERMKRGVEMREAAISVGGPA